MIMLLCILYSNNNNNNNNYSVALVSPCTLRCSVQRTAFTELFPSNGCCTVACLHSCYLALGLHLTMCVCECGEREITRTGEELSGAQQDERGSSSMRLSRSQHYISTALVLISLGSKLSAAELLHLNWH
jgi:hypothetical protein